MLLQPQPSPNSPKVSPATTHWPHSFVEACAQSNFTPCNQALEQVHLPYVAVDLLVRLARCRVVAEWAKSARQRIEVEAVGQVILGPAAE